MSNMAKATPEAGGTIRSLIPARIDRLIWAPFHTRMVMALGTAWILTVSRSRSPARSAPS